MVEIKFSSLEKWFSKKELVWKWTKCKRKKLVNSDNEGRRESEEEEVEKNEDNMKKKGAKFKRSHELLSQLMFDRVELVNSQKGGVQSFFL